MIAIQIMRDFHVRATVTCLSHHALGTSVIVKSIRLGAFKRANGNDVNVPRKGRLGFVGGPGKGGFQCQIHANTLSAYKHAALACYITNREQQQH